jgi:hypothetical protein
LAFVCAMGTASYYAHLHENDDSQSGETASPIALVVGAMGA